MDIPALRTMSMWWCYRPRQRPRAPGGACRLRVRRPPASTLGLPERHHHRAGASAGPNRHHDVHQGRGPAGRVESTPGRGDRRRPGRLHLEGRSCRQQARRRSAGRSRGHREAHITRLTSSPTASSRRCSAKRAAGLVRQRAATGLGGGGRPREWADGRSRPVSRCARSRKQLRAGRVRSCVCQRGRQWPRRQC
jgi:hypothetical protein